jgi:deoxyribose-phosphate aldolase
VYPARVADALKTFNSIGMAEKIPIAAVATGFPSGQYHLKTRLEEIRLTVADGASEIDIVINRTAALTGKWQGLSHFICVL